MDGWRDFRLDYSRGFKIQSFGRSCRSKSIFSSTCSWLDAKLSFPYEVGNCGCYTQRCIHESPIAGDLLPDHLNLHSRGFRGNLMDPDNFGSVGRTL